MLRFAILLLTGIRFLTQVQNSKLIYENLKTKKKQICNLCMLHFKLCIKCKFATCKPSIYYVNFVKYGQNNPFFFAKTEILI